MRSLQCVIVEAKTVHEEDIKSLISSLKSLLFYGTPIHPVNLAIIPPKKLKHDDDLFLDRVVSSDSDHSDSETMDRYSRFSIKKNNIKDFKLGKFVSMVYLVFLPLQKVHLNCFMHTGICSFPAVPVH